MIQILSYSIYLLISSFITIYVGWKCYKHGHIYILHLVHDERISIAINKILLLGYYLLNIGYISWSLSTWQHVTALPDVTAQISMKVGFITSILCVLHYTNITVIYFLRRLFNHSKNNIP